MIKRRDLFRGAGCASLSSLWGSESSAFGLEKGSGGHENSVKPMWFQNPETHSLSVLNEPHDQWETTGDFEILKVGDPLGAATYQKEDVCLFPQKTFPFLLISRKRNDCESIISFLIYDEGNRRVNHLVDLDGETFPPFSQDDYSHFMPFQNEADRGFFSFGFLNHEGRFVIANFDIESRLFAVLYESAEPFIDTDIWAEEDLFLLNDEIFPGRPDVFCKMKAGEGISFYDILFSSNGAQLLLLCQLHHGEVFESSGSLFTTRFSFPKKKDSQSQINNHFPLFISQFENSLPILFFWDPLGRKFFGISFVEEEGFFRSYLSLMSRENILEKDAGMPFFYVLPHQNSGNPLIYLRDRQKNGQFFSFQKHEEGIYEPLLLTVRNVQEQNASSQNIWPFLQEKWRDEFYPTVYPLGFSVFEKSENFGRWDYVFLTEGVDGGLFQVGVRVSENRELLLSGEPLAPLDLPPSLGMTPGRRRSSQGEVSEPADPLAATLPAIVGSRMMFADTCSQARYNMLRRCETELDRELVLPKPHSPIKAVRFGLSEVVKTMEDFEKPFSVRNTRGLEMTDQLHSLFYDREHKLLVISEHWIMSLVKLSDDHFKGYASRNFFLSKYPELCGYVNFLRCDFRRLNISEVFLKTHLWSERVDIQRIFLWSIDAYQSTVSEVVVDTSMNQSTLTSEMIQKSFAEFSEKSMFEGDKSHSSLPTETYQKLFRDIMKVLNTDLFCFSQNSSLDVRYNAICSRRKMFVVGQLCARSIVTDNLTHDNWPLKPLLGKKAANRLYYQKKFGYFGEGLELRKIVSEVFFPRGHFQI